MILFYKKNNGEIFATVDGRVHSEAQLGMYAEQRDPKTKEVIEVGKYIIGYIAGKDGKVQYNMHMLPEVEKMEDKSGISPMDYRVDTESGELVLKQK